MTSEEVDFSRENFHGEEEEWATFSRRVLPGE